MTSDFSHLQALLGISEELDRIGMGVPEDRMSRFLSDYENLLKELLYSISGLYENELKYSQRILQYFSNENDHILVYRGKHCEIEVRKQSTGGIRAIQVIFDDEVRTRIYLTIH